MRQSRLRRAAAFTGPTARITRVLTSGSLQLICRINMMLLRKRGSIMALKGKFIVRLTAEQRRDLGKRAATGKRSAATIRRARILLKADADADGWPDERIAEALDTSAATVA